MCSPCTYCKISPSIFGKCCRMRELQEELRDDDEDMVKVEKMRAEVVRKKRPWGRAEGFRRDK